jgi:exosortase/archaeosortase family protein
MPMKRDLKQIFDFAYFIKFLVIFLAFYYFNLGFIGITAPGGTSYFPFLDHHLNYVAWLRNSILSFANLIGNMGGLHSHIVDSYTLGSNGFNITIVYSCLGLGIMSFWAAFILADNKNLKRKLFWTFAGIIIIWLINCIRMVVLLSSMKNNWRALSSMDHHDVFNIISYILIGGLICFYYRITKKSERIAVT